MKRQQTFLIRLFLFFLLTGVSQTILADTKYSLRQEHHILYLQAGSEKRILLDSGQPIDAMEMPLKVDLPGSYSISSPSSDLNKVTIFHHKRIDNQISIFDTLQKWLKSDAIWGDHERANWIRGVANHEGLQGHLTNLTPTSETAIAVLTWTSIKGSGKAIKAQQLVRIWVKPQATMEFLRNLDLPVHEWIYTGPYPCRRLLSAGKRLFIYTLMDNPSSGGKAESMPVPDADISLNTTKGPTSKLIEITEDGKEKGFYAKLPTLYYPVGIVNAKYLILQVQAEHVMHPIWIYDLSRKTLKPLPGDWKDAYCLPVPEEGSNILVGTFMENTLRSLVIHVVNIVTGRHIAIQNIARSGIVCLWKGVVVMVDTQHKTVNLYNASNGRLLQQIKMPA